MRPRLLAPSLITFGFLLAVTAAMLPGEPRWNHADVAAGEHITTLARDGDGVLHAGTQSGRLWRFYGASDWRDVGGTLGAEAVTVMRPDPEGLLVGTSNGLFRWRGDWEQLLPRGRISDIRPPGPDRAAPFLVATGNRVLERRDDGWADTDASRAIGDTPIYRALARNTEAGWYLHAGTVGSGVWSLSPGGTGWTHDSQGLPEGIKVFALEQADNGLLLAGTDQGLYWQATTGEQWRRLNTGPDAWRVLDLALRQRPQGTLLLAASDDGVRSIALVERSRSLETRGRWQHVGMASRALDAPVSRIVADGDTVWIAAGSVYRLTTARPALWLVAMAAGGAMVLAGLYLIATGRRRGHAAL